MAIYTRYFRVTAGPLMDKAREINADRQHNRQAIIAFCHEIGAENEAQKQILLKAGWQRLASFPNSKTGGSTEIWGWQVGDGGAA